MERTRRRIRDSFIAVLVSVSLVLTMTPALAFANPGDAGEGDEPIVYVSLGDSMTNGYGLDGYDGESGILNYGNDVYANQFAAYLAGYTGEIADDQTVFTGENGTVDHRQLAMSGMRAEDLHWILDFDHTDAELAARAIASRGAPYAHWCSTERQGAEFGDPMGERWYHDTENFGFKAGDYRTWWDLLDPNYRLADGAAKVLSTYYDTSNDAYGFYESSYADVVTTSDKTITEHAIDSKADSYYPGDNDAAIEMGTDKGTWLQVATEYYQKSVEEADVISLALGNTNFGTFMFQYMKEIIANSEKSDRNNDFIGRYSLDDVYYVADFSPEMKAEVDELLNLVDDIVDANFDEEMLPELDPNVTEFDSMKEYIKYVIKYCILSYVVNYVAVVERTLELNPDADIIQIALMNAYAAADNGEVEGMSMGELIDMLYDPLNAFIAVLPTYLQMDGAYPDATFYYADCGTVETMTDVFGDDYYYDADGNYLEYPGLDHSKVADVNANSTSRQRFAFWITGYCSRGNQHPVVGLCYCAHDGHKGNVGIEYGEFWKNVLIPVTDPAYKTATTDYSKAAQNFFGTFDLMFLMDNGTKDYQRLVDYLKLSEEDRWTALNDDTVVKTESQTKNGETYTFEYTKKDLAFSCEMYLAFEDAIIRAGKSSVAVANLGQYGSFDLSACQSAFDKFYEKQGITSMTDEVNFESYEQVKALFQSLSDELVEDPTSNVMLAMANRMEIGTGIGGHTSAGGHTDMYESIKKVYEEGYTAQDETKKILLGFLNANYPNLMAAVGAAEGIGNIDDLDIIIEMLKMSNNEAVKDVDLDELEASIRELQAKYEEDLTPEEQLVVLETANDLMEYVQNLASNVTNSKYEVTEDSFYVSLGDSNVTGFGLPTYEEGTDFGRGQVVDGAAPVELAKLLYGEGWEDHFAQDAQGALRCEDMLSLLTGEVVNNDEYWQEEIYDNLMVENDLKATHEALKADIEQADLISIAVGGGNITTFVGRQLDLVVAGEEAMEMDWESIGVETSVEVEELNALLDDLVPIVDTLGLLNAYLPEGMTVSNPAAFSRVLAESLLFGYASYNYYYPQVLDTLRAMNPDAQILILGMFNPVDDWTVAIEIEGVEQVVPIGGITNNLILSANLQNLAFAVQTENTTFVDIHATETFLDADIAAGAADPTFATYYESIVKGNGKEVHANEAGHAYITEQMLAALQDDYTWVDFTDDTIKLLLDQLAKMDAEDVSDGAQWLYNYLMNNPDEVIAFFEEHGDDMVTFYNENLEEIAAVFDFIVQEYGEETAQALFDNADVILPAMVELLKEHGDEAWALIELYAEATGVDETVKSLLSEGVEGIRNAVEDATHGKYFVDGDSKYVAIGDMTVAGNGSYAQLLSDHINDLAGYDVPVVNLNEDGESLLAQDILAKVETDETWRQHIAEADFITVSVGQENLTTYVNSSIIGILDGQDVECDWASIVGQEGVVHVDAALDKLYAELLESLGNEAAAGMALDLVEAYAYGYATFTISYAEVLDAIQAINGDAQVVVVGLNNAFGDMASINLSSYGFEAPVEIGGYVDFIIDSTDMLFLAYALVAGDEDITFVSAPDAETAVSVKSFPIGMGTLLRALNTDADWTPSLAGHEYIYQQIIGAVEITAEAPEFLLGDVDGDGNVFPNDAMLVLQYYVGSIAADDIILAAADVDGDGNVFPNDAMLILQYYVGSISEFPAAA